MGKRTWHDLGGREGLCGMRGRSEPVNTEGKAARGTFLLPQAPLSPGPSPRACHREARLYYPSSQSWDGRDRGRCDGEGSGRLLVPSHSTCRLPLARGRVRLPRLLGPWPLPHLPHTSVPTVSGQPDPRAKPAGVTMPSPQTSPWAPRKHCLCGRGLLSVLPDLEPRGGIGLLEFGEHDITEEADPLPAG